MLMTVAMLRKFGGTVIFLILLALAGCNPLDSLSDEKVGESMYLVDRSRLFGNENDLGLKDILVYPASERKGPENVSTNVSNKLLARYRCTWCHECGFTEAFDYANYGTDDWDPVYVGEAWRPVVQRMNDDDETLLNEQIAERIYSYLRDETLGIYDPDEDRAPEIRIEVDDISDVQVLQGDVVDEDGNPVADDAADESGSGSAEGQSDGPDEPGEDAQS